MTGVCADTDAICVSTYNSHAHQLACARTHAYDPHRHYSPTIVIKFVIMKMRAFQFINEAPTMLLIG